MNGTLSKVLIFAAGAAIGSVVTWRVLKPYYEQIAQEEIDDVKRKYCIPKDEDENGKAEETEEVEEEPESYLGEKPELTDYKSLLRDCGYVNEATEEGMHVDKPYVVSPNEFGERDGYGTETLYYTSDKVLIDDMDHKIENVDALVGEESLNHFGEYEDDSVFVRNDSAKTDFEILLESRTYKEIVNKDRANDE